MISTIILNGLSVEGTRNLRQANICWSQGLYCPKGCNPDRQEHWDVLSQQALIALMPARHTSDFLFTSPRISSKPYRLRVSILASLKEMSGVSSGWSWNDLVQSARRARNVFTDEVPPCSSIDAVRSHQRAMLDKWAMELLRQNDEYLAEKRREQQESEELAEILFGT